jgi:gliding motility-associated-like protein
VNGGTNLQDYTAGNDGILNRNFWDGIDREVRVDRGEIKTSYVLRQPIGVLQGATTGQVSISEFIPLPADYALEQSDGVMTPAGLWFGELALTEGNGNELARFGRPLVYDDSMQSFDASSIPVGYVVKRTATGVWIDIRVDLAWLNAPGRVYPVTIDPLVTGTNTYNSGVMGFQYDVTCWNQANYCSYPMTVTVPGQTTLIGAVFDVHYHSEQNGCSPGVDCWMSQAAFRIYGTCGFSPGGALYWTCLPPTGNAPGDCTGTGYDMSSLISCFPPQCADYNLSFEMRTYHCACSKPPCATSCHYMPNSSWKITITGRTVESTAWVTGSSVICEGSSVNINSSGSYGVPGYSYQWNPGAINSQNTTVSPTTTTTYTVTVTDQCANTSTSTVTITVRPKPVLTLSSTGVSCFGGNDGTATVTATGGTTFTYNWNSAPPQNTATATGLVAGTYTVTVTNNYGCSTTGSITVSQPGSALTASISGFSNVSCFGGTDGSATVTAAGGTPAYTYAWNTTPVQNSATAGSLPAGTYTVTVTDSKGCTATASVTITQPPDLVLTTNSTNPSCNVPSGSASVATIGGTPPYTYLWSTVPPQTTPVVGGLTAGTYTVTVTDSEGCQKTASVTLVNPQAVTLVTSFINVTCNGGTDGEATVTVTTGTPPFTYSWSTTPTQTSPTAVALAAGTYTVTVTDANGCQQTASVTLTQPPGVLLSFSKTDVTCSGASDGTATVTATGGLQPYTYAWNTSPSQGTPTATGLASGSWSVTVTDANGCATNGSVTVLGPPPFSVNVIGTDPTCNGGNDGSATAIPVNGTVPISYLWSTTPAQTVPTAVNLSGGVYTITLTDANGCQAIGSVTLAQPNALTASATSTDATCHGASDGTASVTASGGTSPYTYSWSTVPPQTTSSVANLPASTYTVTITDVSGCYVIIQVTILEPPPLVITLSSADVSCNGLADGQATANLSGGTAPFTFSWSTTPVQTGQTAVSLTAGVYDVTVTDANGCNGVGSVTITEPGPLLLTTSQVPESCSGISNGQATVTVSGGNAPFTYAWSTSPSQTTATATGLAAGSYSVTVVDANGCSQTATVSVSVDNSLAANLSPVDVSCFGLSDGSVDLTPSGGSPPYTFLWSNASVSEDLAGLQPGTYTVTVTDNAGCTATGSVVISQPAAISVNLGTDRTIDQGQTITLNSTVTPPGTYTYLWQPPTGLDNPMSGSPQASPATTTVYTLTVTDGNGCSAQDDIIVEVVPPAVILLPSAFTPNGDGLNDYFFDPADVSVEIILLTIYNRWGDAIYSSALPWDGNGYGQAQPIGSYVFDVEVRFAGTTLTNSYRGNVTLLR